MSIQSEISRISGNIADAYTAVDAKGGTLPATQNSDNLAAAIESISGGGGDIVIDNMKHLQNLDSYGQLNSLAQNNDVIINQNQITGNYFIDTQLFYFASYIDNVDNYDLSNIYVKLYSPTTNPTTLEDGNCHFSHGMFYNCRYITELPQISAIDINKNTVTDVKYLIMPSNSSVTDFFQCYRLKNIPNDFYSKWQTIGFVVPNGGNLTNMYFIFTNKYLRCYSLRNVPPLPIAIYYRSGFRLSTSGTIANTYRNYCLDCVCVETVHLPVLGGIDTNYTSFMTERNQFSTGSSSTNLPILQNCNRLTHLIFDHPSGTYYYPECYVTSATDLYTSTITWHSVTYTDDSVFYWDKQIVDLSSDIGYGTAIENYTDYHGITTAKKVDSLASYNELKDDPDWYATTYEWSRYNVDSLAETIQSLPYTTGSNTLKVKSGAGSGYGKSVNDLDAASIALASAKGWTISYI